MTLDMRNLGVSWTLHCWMHTLALADDLRLEHMIDQLLQDFLQVWPDDCSTQFVDECLPLLFSIFRYSKVTSAQAFNNSNTLSLFINSLSLCFLFLFSEWGYNFIAGGYILYLFWLGTNQTSSRYNLKWRHSYWPQVCEQSRAVWCSVSCRRSSFLCPQDSFGDIITSIPGNAELKTLWG